MAGIESISLLWVGMRLWEDAEYRAEWWRKFEEMYAFVIHWTIAEWIKFEERWNDYYVIRWKLLYDAINWEETIWVMIEWLLYVKVK